MSHQKTPRIIGTTCYVEARKVVTTVDVYKEIRRLQLDGVTSQRQAAKLLGISRNTVKKYWDGSAVPWEHKEYTRASPILTPDVVQFIAMCLDEDDTERVKKQHHTARRIYNRLVEERSFTGSESSVRNAVHEMRAARKATEVFVPLSFSPGDSMQVDWGEATIYLGGERVKVNAVKSGFGAHAAAQEGYSQLAAHYGFLPVFCNPASGNEKGLVENLVGYIRRNVCVPLPRVSSLEDLNGKLLEQCVKYLEHHIDGRPGSVGRMLEEDQLALQRLPKYSIDVSKKAYPSVSRYSTVLFETNHYSVPCKYRGKETTLKAYPNTVEIWINGELAATHNRCLGRKQESLDLQHYLPILQQKGRAIRYAKPVLNTVPIEFIDWMENQQLTSKEMVELLELCLAKGYKAVMQHRCSVPDTISISDEVGVQHMWILGNMTASAKRRWPRHD